LTTATSPSAIDNRQSSIEDVEAAKRACANFRDIYAKLRAEVGKVIVGQDEIVDLALTALFADGHILLEGVPGLGKTLLVRTLSEALSLPFRRIQFTPDIMPADITGTSIVIENEVTGHREFQFRPGPIFSQLLLADEINRATPKSQAALLEAMQERSVTVAGKTHQLVRPFFVMATQNPIEQEGTYALPEAQLDRFILKILVPYATQKELNEILRRTTSTRDAHASPVLDAENILRAQRLAKRVIAAPVVQDYAIRLVLATHPGAHVALNPESHPSRREKGRRFKALGLVDSANSQSSIFNRQLAAIHRYIRVGVSPRGAQSLIACAKVRAIIDGRYALAFRDLHDVAHAALRHRIIRSFEAEADAVTTDDIVDRLIDILPREG
jgi:MoxR-like ATPase